jgi:integrase
MTELSIVGRWSEHRDRLLETYKLTWLEDDDEPQRSPVTKLGHRKGQAPPNKGKRFPASPPTPAEVMRMLALCGEGYVGRRNRALIVCLWRSGLRVSEALALRPYHVDMDDNTVTVMSGKGGKRRTVGIDPWGAEQIAAWIGKRNGLRVVQDAPLFCTVSQPTPGGPVNTAYVREMVRELAKRAEVPHRVAPHQFRHALAVSLARETVPMHLIQRQLGHSNLGTTATYLEGIAPFEVVNAMTARPAPEAQS